MPASFPGFFPTLPYGGREGRVGEQPGDEVGIVLNYYPVSSVNKNDDSRNDCYQHREDQQGSMKLSNIKKTTTYVQFKWLKL